MNNTARRISLFVFLAALTTAAAAQYTDLTVTGTTTTGKLKVNGPTTENFAADVATSGTNGFRVARPGAVGIELTAVSDLVARILSYDRSANAWRDLFIEHADNGAGTMFKSSGRVGIGTADPQALLHVYGSQPTLRIEDSGPVRASLRFYLEATERVTMFADAAGFHLETGNGSPVERLTVLANGRVGLGVASPQENLHVAGNIRADGVIQAKYQDLAEWVPATEPIAPGTVVVVAARNHVSPSSAAYDTAVAGVVSAQPGIALGEAGQSKVLVATTGRVKVRVDATKSPIREGDLLVSSPARGVAMKSAPLSLDGRSFHQPGTIIGKALEPLEHGSGEILVLLSLQ